MDCCECQARIQSATALNANLLIAGLGKHQHCVPPGGMLDRFTARAMSEGIPLKPSSSKSSTSIVLGIPVAVLVVLILVFLTWKMDHSISPNALATVSGTNSRATFPQSSNPGTVDSFHELRKIPSRRSGNRRADHLATMSRLASNSTGLPRSEPVFANRPHWGRFESGEMTPGLKYVGETRFAPNLPAPFMQLDLISKSAPLASPRSCDGGGAQIWIRNDLDPSERPVFCFDPQLAFMSDSTMPRLFRLYRNRSGEMQGLPVFQFTPPLR